MPIHQLQVRNLGPFDDICFDFDPHMNVFVGPNNCGKTTALMALGDIAVFPFVFPEKLLRRKSTAFSVRLGPTKAKSRTHKGTLPIAFGSKHWGQKRLQSYAVLLEQLGYSCLIPALRWNTDYRAESPIGQKRSRNRELRRVERVLASGEVERVVVRKRVESQDEESEDLLKRKALIETGPTLVRDSDLIQRIINLDYRSYRENNPTFRSVVEKIAEIASEITSGYPIDFVGVKEDTEGLYPEVSTPDGTLPMNVLSQGTQSIIQWLGIMLIGYAEYYDFPKNLEDEAGVVMIDEIDAHMHPSWQRRILPVLSRHFPNLQFFCATHSPLVLAGLEAGQVQLLKRDSKGKVVVSRNDTDIRGWSSDEILRNFLDITNPTDLETSKNIERLQELKQKRRLTPKQKREMESLGEKLSRSLVAGPAAAEIEEFAKVLRSSSSRTPSTPRKRSPKKRKRPSAAKKD